MSDDIVFIKDENDYNEYSKLKPVNTYKYKKVKFICTVCKNESIKSFRNLKIPFKCRHCTIVENNTSKEIKDAIQKTCTEKYGQPHYSKTEESINKHRNTFIEKYGAKTYKESDEYYNKWLSEFTEKLNVRNFKYIKTENKRRYIKCLTCNNVFSFSISGFNVLLKNIKNHFARIVQKFYQSAMKKKN